MINVKQFIMNEFGYTDEQFSAFVGSVTFTMMAKQMRKIAQAASTHEEETVVMLVNIMNAIPVLPLETAKLIFNDHIKGSDDEFDLEMKREEENEAQNSSDDEFEQDDPAKFKHILSMLNDEQQKTFIRDLHSQYTVKRPRIEVASRNRNVCG